MDEVIVATNSGSISSAKNYGDISFGEKKYRVFKLKAGKFYEALKIYMQMVSEVAPKTDIEKKENSVDLDKLIITMFQTWPERMVKFVSVCCTGAKNVDESNTEKVELTEEYILNEAFPEQITEAFNVCVKLNNVMENVKNFVAPIGNMGMGEEATKTQN